jgi:four helix bundle protein
MSETTQKNKIRSFTDLEAWKAGHALVLAVYSVTKSFPKDELFGLTSQLRRAAVSVTSNIAEGFSRSTYKEKTRFYYMALGSLTEVQNQLLIARDIKYCTPEDFTYCSDQTIQVSKLLNGLIRSSREKY